MIRDYYYEIHEGTQDGVRVIATCGSADDARMMCELCPEGRNRSWVRIKFLPPDTVDTTAEKVEQVVLPQRKDLPQGIDVVWNGPKSGFGFR